MPPAEHVTDQDIESLAHKLSEFMRNLTPGERAAFAIVEQHLLTVAEQPAEVQGYQFPSLDTLSVETRHADLLRQARQHLTTDNQPGFWRALLGVMTRRGTHQA